MTFLRWPEIQNSYQQKFIGIFLVEFPELKDETFAVTEKLHGSNLQIFLESNKPYRVGTRNHFLEEGEKFYDVWNTLAKYQDVIDDVQIYVDELGHSVRLFGEMFGGKIQKGVNYGSEHRIRFFGMMIDDELRPFDELQRLLDDDSLIVPVVGMVQGLATALDVNIEFDSWLTPLVDGEEPRWMLTHVNPDGLVLTSLEASRDNIAEGVVIQPLSKIYRNAGGHTFLLKRKNEAFKEKQKVKRPPEPEDSEVARLNAEFRSYITDMRLQAVFSKSGEIERPDQIGDFIRLVLADAKEDFLQDNQEAVDALDKPQQKRVFNVGGMIANLLKEYL